MYHEPPAAFFMQLESQRKHREAIMFARRDSADAPRNPIPPKIHPIPPKSPPTAQNSASRPAIVAAIVGNAADIGDGPRGNVGALQGKTTLGPGAGRTYSAGKGADHRLYSSDLERATLPDDQASDSAAITANLRSQEALSGIAGQVSPQRSAMSSWASSV
jgi:hypothetical protein